MKLSRRSLLGTLAALIAAKKLPAQVAPVAPVVEKPLAMGGIVPWSYANYVSYWYLGPNGNTEFVTVPIYGGSIKIDTTYSISVSSSNDLNANAVCADAWLLRSDF